MTGKAAEREENAGQEKSAADPNGQRRPATARGRRKYDLRLTAAIIRRMHAMLRERGIPLVVQTIPGFTNEDDPDQPLEFIDLFPYHLIDFGQDGVSCVRAAKHLAPYVGEQQLYWYRSHRHWTPFSHEVMGKAIAEHILENGLLDGP